VTRHYEDLNARARGLGTHLLTRREIETLARAPDLPALAAQLRALGFPVTDTERVTPAALELAVRRRAGAALATLARWCGPRADAAAILFEDEDRRSVRSIVRGAGERVDPELKIAGALPTPSLPERALQELARQPSVRAVATLLVAWRHPYGAPLLAAASPGQPDLLRLELVLNRCFAERSLAAARGGPMTSFVRETIDLENVLAALVLAERADDMIPKDAFLAGGAGLDVAAFEEAVATGGAARAAARLERALGNSPLGRACGRAAVDPAAAEAAALREQIAVQRRAARLDPLGPAPLLAFVLALRAQTTDVRSVIWARALAAPAAVTMAGLVTV
jgi:vacuolar-type H+-ATPase subunit C/Vma6